MLTVSLQHSRLTFDVKSYFSGSGAIDRDEFKQLMSTLGLTLTTAEAQDLLNEADIDGSNCIEFEEFLLIMTKHK